MTDELLFLPRPWQIERRDGAFAPNAATPIQISARPSPDTVRAAQALQAGIQDATGLRLDIVPVAEPGLAGSISLSVRQPGDADGEAGRTISGRKATGFASRTTS